MLFSGALSGLAKMRMQRNPVDVQIASEFSKRNKHNAGKKVLPFFRRFLGCKMLQA